MIKGAFKAPFFFGDRLGSFENRNCFILQNKILPLSLIKKQ